MCLGGEGEGGGGGSHLRSAKSTTFFWMSPISELAKVNVQVFLISKFDFGEYNFNRLKTFENRTNAKCRVNCLLYILWLCSLSSTKNFLLVVWNFITSVRIHISALIDDRICITVKSSISSKVTEQVLALWYTPSLENCWHPRTKPLESQPLKAAGS